MLFALRRSLPPLALSLFAIVTVAAQTSRPQPEIGQPGKDVPWVPTPNALVERILDLAGVTPRDFVIDLGSGDGRTVIAAAKRGARAHGIEYEPLLVDLARRAAAAAGVSDTATFAQADLFQSDFSRATVLTMFLLPEINLQLRPKILALKPGTRVISNTWTMQDWEPDESVMVAGCQTFCTAHLWIVPARVEGRWRLDQGELTLTQRFQNVEGVLKSSEGAVPIAGGKLRGDRLSFSIPAGVTAANGQYVGRIDGNSIQGTVSGPTPATWRATRVGR